MESGRRRDLKRAMDSTTLTIRLFSRRGGKEGSGEIGKRDAGRGCPADKAKTAFKVLSELYAWSVGVWDQLAESHSCMAPVSPQEAKCIYAKLCHPPSF